MKRFLRPIWTIVLICTVMSLTLCACQQPTPNPNIPDEPTPPSIQYTIDESVLDSGKDANDADFYASAVTRVADSPLAGKTIYWLGSSVTWGASSGGESMVEFLAAKTGAICKKDAVSGTTIFDDGKTENTGVKSYTRRLRYGDVFDTNEHIDAFICQISTNDTMNNRLSKRGEITDNSVVDKTDFDLATTLGGVEYIISYVTEVWNCPVYFYSGSYFGDSGSGARGNGDPSGTNYGELVDQVKQVVAKWQSLGYDVDVIDLFNDADFNAQVSDDYYVWCTADRIHPKRAGYLNWWMPYFEQFLIVKFDV